MADTLIPCPRCGGTGSPPPVGMNDGRMVYYYPCPVCMGAGRVRAKTWLDLFGADVGRAMGLPARLMGIDPENDDEWRKARDAAIRSALSARGGDEGKGETNG